MQDTSRVLLHKYCVRHNTNQKEQFQEYLKDVLQEIDCEGEKDRWFRFKDSKNIVFGNPRKAKILLSAHYDTCTQLPLPIRRYPMNRIKNFLGGLPSAYIAVPLVAFLSILLFTSKITELQFSIFMLLAVALQYFVSIFVARANPHTHNDNTSGVILLLELIKCLDKETLKHVAFIFFDNEEKGLIGSKRYKKKHKDEIKNQLLINFDCVGDGNTELIIYNAGAEKYIKRIDLEENGVSVMIKSSKCAHYSSDQNGFPNGIAVVMLNKDDRNNYYLDKIHTKNDKICKEENISYLCKQWKRCIESILEDYYKS